MGDFVCILKVKPKRQHSITRQPFAHTYFNQGYNIEKH